MKAWKNESKIKYFCFKPSNYPCVRRAFGLPGCQKEHLFHPPLAWHLFHVFIYSSPCCGDVEVHCWLRLNPNLQPPVVLRAAMCSLSLNQNAFWLTVYTLSFTRSYPSCNELWVIKSVELGVACNSSGLEDLVVGRKSTWRPLWMNCEFRRPPRPADFVKTRLNIDLYSKHVKPLQG